MVHALQVSAEGWVTGGTCQAFDRGRLIRASVKMGEASQAFDRGRVEGLLARIRAVRVANEIGAASAAARSVLSFFGGVSRRPAPVMPFAVQLDQPIARC